jgi:peptidoglycan/LPS O-acetylase OafA/YrhL
MGAQAQSPRRLGRRAVLDGMRGLAIVLVMLMHTDVLHNGYAGVDLFFALSGFLITSLLYEEWDRTGGIRLRRFYARRARRLFPALALFVVLALVVNVACYRLTGWPFAAKALASMAFVNNWLAATGHAASLGSFNPTWSLAQEEQFYLLWPPLLLLALRRGAGPRQVAMLLAGAIALLLALAPIGAGHGYAIYYSPAARSGELLAGCLAAVAWRHRLLRLPAWLGARAPVRLLVGAKQAATVRSTIALILALLLAGLLLDRALPSVEVYLSACAIGTGLIVAMIGAPASLVARALSVAPLRFLGRISYGLYLFHLLLRNVVYHYVTAGSVYADAALTFALSTVLATLSWRLVESRLLRGSVSSQQRKPRERERHQLLPARA